MAEDTYILDCDKGKDHKGSPFGVCGKSYGTYNKWAKSMKVKCVF